MNCLNQIVWLSALRDPVLGQAEAASLPAASRCWPVLNQHVQKDHLANVGENFHWINKIINVQVSTITTAIWKVYKNLQKIKAKFYSNQWLNGFIYSLSTYFKRIQNLESGPSKIGVSA